MRLLYELSLEEVDLHHNLACPHEADCLDWVDQQHHPRWKAYTCRFCPLWTRKPHLA